MDKESIITLCIAVYGALLSTYQWIDSILARKRTIKIEIALALLAPRVGPLQQYIVITIRNPGNRSVTINQPIVQIPDKSQVIFRCKVGHTIVKNASRVKTALVWCHECLKHQKDAALPEAKYLKLIDRFNAALERKGYRKEQPESKPDELNRVHVRCSKGHLNWLLLEQLRLN